MTTAFLANVGHYVPELLAVVTMIGLLFTEAAYSKFDNRKNYIVFGSIVGLVFVLISLISNLSLAATPVFTNAVIIDPFSTFIKIVMVLGTLGAIYINSQSDDVYDNLKSEFVIMSIGVLIGGMLLASANNFLTVYLGIEMLSILSYVMASLKKNNSKSNEAGLKYALYGGITSGIMLFGMSHIYGALGTIQFSEALPMIESLTKEQMLILLPSFILVFVGLGYKIACVPFHMWSPDVYEGSPIPVTTFFAIVPKVAGVAVLVRITMVFFGNESVISEGWISSMQLIAALTMTIGNVLAIGQKSVKRMLAYSSISHAGFMLMGVLAIGETGTTALIYYSVAYLFMTLVAFGITTFLSDDADTDRFDIFNGLIKSYPVITIIMAITMFSLAGLPPFSGFVAKFNILSAVVEKGYFTIAVIAAINSVVSLYYYTRIVRLMIFGTQERTTNVERLGIVNHAVLIALCFPIVFLGLFWEKLIGIAQGSILLVQ